jgi:hypothetical protein
MSIIVTLMFDNSIIIMIRVQVPQAQGRHPYAKHLHRSCPLDFQTGKQSLFSDEVSKALPSLSLLFEAIHMLLPCRYSYGQFVEINSHSLFSKWFSEVKLKWSLD